MNPGLPNSISEWSSVMRTFKEPKKDPETQRVGSHFFYQGRNDQPLYLLSLFLLPPWWGSKSELASGERKKKSYHPPLLQRQMASTYRPQCGVGRQTLLLSKTRRIWLTSWPEYVLITESRLCFVTLSDFRTVYSWRNEQKSHRPCPSFHPRSEKFYTKGVYFIGHWETK